MKRLFVSVLGASWSGVDESVVEHYAEKAGRSTWTPFINTDQGDLLLFVFLLAGVIGGFIIGFYWRVLFTSELRNSEARNQNGSCVAKDAVQ